MLDYRIYGGTTISTPVDTIDSGGIRPDSEHGEEVYRQMMSLASQGDRGNAFYRFAKEYYDRRIPRRMR